MPICNAITDLTYGLILPNSATIKLAPNFMNCPNMNIIDATSIAHAFNVICESCICVIGVLTILCNFQCPIDGLDAIFIVMGSIKIISGQVCVEMKFIGVIFR